MKRCCLVLTLGMLAVQPAQSQGVFGPDFQVNVATGSPYSATITGGDGGFVVVWSGTDDGFYGGITGRRLAADGSPIGADFQINTVTTLFQFAATAATGADDRFIVTWASGELTAGGESEIAARVFDSTGTPLGPDEVQVNAFTTGKQSAPAVSSAEDGSFVVVWKSPVYGYPDYEIRARRLAADGSPLAAEFQVNGSTTGEQLYPSVATTAGGDFVVVWHEYSGADDFEIEGRRFTSDGSPIGADFQVNSYDTGIQAFPVVRAAPAGEFLVAWQSGGSAGDDQDSSSVQARLYSSDGTPLSAQAQVNVYTTSAQFRPEVAAAADGRFVVTWIDGSAFTGGQDGDGYGVFARTIATGGTPAGDEFRVNAYTTSSQRIPAVARSGDRFVVVWQGTGPPVERSIFGRRLSPDLVFYDGFESGDLSAWSSSEP